MDLTRSVKIPRATDKKPKSTAPQVAVPFHLTPAPSQTQQPLSRTMPMHLHTMLISLSEILKTSIQSFEPLFARYRGDQVMRWVSHDDVWDIRRWC